MNPISNKILTTAIQTADTLSETSQASTAQQNPKAATSDSIGKATSFARAYCSINVLSV